MEKEKKEINVLTAFFISHKSDIKTFLKLILNQCRTVLVNMTLFNNTNNVTRTTLPNDLFAVVGRNHKIEVL